MASPLSAQAALASETIERKLELMLQANSGVSLLLVVDLETPEVVLRRLREGAVQPSESTVATYCNLFTAAALEFEVSNHHGGGGGATSPSNLSTPPHIAGEEWGFARFRTKHWDVAAYREEKSGTTLAGKRWLLVAFSAPTRHGA